MNNSLPIDVARDFCANFGPTPDDVVATCRRLVHPGASLQYLLMDENPIESLDALVADIEHHVVTTGAAKFRIDVHSMSADGNTVLMHRTDDLLDKDDNIIISLDMMSFFLVEDGRIRLMRDYFFDPRSFVQTWTS